MIVWEIPECFPNSPSKLRRTLLTNCFGMRIWQYLTLPVSPKCFLNNGPSLRIMPSSFALYFSYRETVINKTSSCGWPKIFSFIFFNTRSTTCSARICAFALIPFIEYDVVFPSIFVNSFTLVSKTDGSSFAAHCFVFVSIVLLVQGFALLTCRCCLFV